MPCSLTQAAGEHSPPCTGTCVVLLPPGLFVFEQGCPDTPECLKACQRSPVQLDAASSLWFPGSAATYAKRSSVNTGYLLQDLLLHTRCDIETVPASVWAGRAAVWGQRRFFWRWRGENIQQGLWQRVESVLKESLYSQLGLYTMLNLRKIQIIYYLHLSLNCWGRGSHKKIKSPFLIFFKFTI